MPPHALPSIALTLALCGAPAAAGAACFDRGIEALDAGRFAAAADAFEAAAERPACAADAVDLRFNAAFALQRLADDGDPAAACRAVAAYREVLASTPDPDLARTARTRVAELEPTCLVGRPSSRSWALRSAIAAGIAGAGTAVVYALALDADGDRAAAKTAYIDHRRSGRAAEAEDARRRFEDARNTTDALGLTAYVGLGLTLALAGLAVGGWLTDDGSARVSIAPRGLSVEVTW